MSRSPQDTITITREDGNGFELFTSVEAIGSIVRPSEASFELGDQGSWDDMSDFVSIGRKFTVAVNQCERVTGRVQILETPLDANQGMVLRFVVRTKLSDVEFSSADTKIRTKDVSIQQVIEAVLAPQNIKPSDLVYQADVARDVMTGKRTQGGAARKDLSPLTEKQAAVQPGETIKVFLDRHLRRHGLMIWDGPDGRIVVSEPDDEQDPIYFFRNLRGSEGQFNNFLASGRGSDVTGVPTSVTAFGYGGGADFRRSKVSAQLTNDPLVDLGFYRPCLIVDEGLKTNQLAQRTVAREYSERLRRQDFIPIKTDGLAFADGVDRVPYVHDTVAEVLIEGQGQSLGRYYVEEVKIRRDPSGGDLTDLGLVKAGTWAL